MDKPLVLSTKKLRFDQLERLVAARCAVLDYDAINIDFQTFDVPSQPTYWVFSSQNAVRSFLANPVASWARKPIVCVGEKTKSVLEENGQKVTKMAKNMRELVDFIQKNAKDEHFLHLCGSRKLPDFALGMQDADISFSEVTTYTTLLNARVQNPEPQGLLFFSPSGVESYLQNNRIGASWCFCIGNTTASAVRMHTDKITVPTKTEIYLVVAAAAKHFRV